MNNIERITRENKNIQDKASLLILDLTLSEDSMSEYIKGTADNKCIKIQRRKIVRRN